MSSRCSLPFRFSILYTVFISPMLLHNLPISSSLILSPFESVHFHNLSKWSCVHCDSNSFLSCILMLYFCFCNTAVSTAYVI
jgi:hypothetical protein